MKVLDLHCQHGHAFEGWFASEDDFQSQLGRALVECPVCGETSITKMLSAPRINLGASEPAAKESGKTAVMTAPDAQMQAQWLQMVRHVMANTDDVGDRFAEEARRIHYGEVEQRNIRGQATPQQTEALLEEGIGVMPLPIPKAFKETLQ